MVKKFRPSAMWQSCEPTPRRYFATSTVLRKSFQNSSLSKLYRLCRGQHNVVASPICKVVENIARERGLKRLGRRDTSTTPLLAGDKPRIGKILVLRITNSVCKSDSGKDRSTTNPIQ